MRLVQLTGDTGHLSVFKLLLIVYNQIRKEDGTAEPLRRILQDGTYFVFNLGYHEPWRNDRPASIKHAYYIPSAADLVGKPSSPPTMDRHLIGLWGLINLELDTWQDLVTQDISPELFTKLPGHQLSLHRPVGNYARIQANSNSLAPLTSWLTDIEANPDLPALEGAGSADISGLLARLNKIQMFLRVRQECADERKLSAILANINTITHQPNKDPAPAIRDLITAATPIEAGGKQEVLYDAAIWLRYLMLSSYRNEGFSAVGNGSNALAAIWTHYKLPQSFLLESAKLGVDDSPRGAFLR